MMQFAQQYQQGSAGQQEYQAYEYNNGGATTTVTVTPAAAETVNTFSNQLMAQTFQDLLESMSELSSHTLSRTMKSGPNAVVSSRDSQTH